MKSNSVITVTLMGCGKAITIREKTVCLLVMVVFFSGSGFAEYPAPLPQKMKGGTGIRQMAGVEWSLSGKPWKARFAPD